MQLEIGKKYRTRNTQEVITIIGIEDKTAPLYRATHPYLGDDDEVYSPTGQFNEDGESPYDLIHEVIQIER